MKFDIISKIGKSVIQHGPNNDRVYLMKLDPQDIDTVIVEIDKLVHLNKYSKAIAKIPNWAKPHFESHGYCIEAIVPSFFNNSEAGFFMAKYYDSKRGVISEAENDLIKSIIMDSNSSSSCSQNHWGKFKVRILNENDTIELSNLYRKVFKVYPFPIFENDFLSETMKNHVVYFGVYFENKLVAASSSEMDITANNAEMTDFATLNDFRGMNLSLLLLKEMIKTMRDSKISMLYTIARATSFGMNKTFSREGFQFGGTLKNNTYIGESIESMNVWYKIF